MITYLSLSFLTTTVITLAPIWLDKKIYIRRICRYPIGWFEVGEAGLIRPDLVHKDMEKVNVKVS